jgi:tight adherence protein B
MRRALLAAVLLWPGAASAGVTLRTIDTTAYPKIRATVVAPAAPAVTEDGRPVTALHVQNLGRSKSVVLVIDRSQSMAGRSLADAVSAASAFVAAKRPADRIAVVALGSAALGLTGFSSATIDADTALRGISVDGRQGTALYDAVALAARELATEALPGRVIVLLTDGRDVSSRASLADAVSAARAAGAAVYSIAIEGPQFSPAPLRALARRTGGTFRGTSSSAGLADLYAAIARELDHTWVLQYETAARPGDRIRVAVTGAAPVELTLPGAAEAAKARPFIPRALLTPAGTVLLAFAVGLVILLAGFLALSVHGAGRLRGRLAPHVGQSKAKEKPKGARNRLAVLSGLFRATERAFGHLRHWRRLERLLERADLPLRAVELVWVMAAAGLGLGLIVAVSGASSLFILGGFALGGLVPLVAVSFKAKRRLRAFENQLPDMLSSLAASLKAGHSFKQGIQAIVDEGFDPMSKELKRVLAETQLGRPIEDALGEMAERVGSEDFAFIVTAVAIQNQVGGSLAGLFDMVSDTVRQRQQFARKIRSLTAMGRMSAYVLVGLPFFVAVAITALNSTYMYPLYHTSTGHKLIIAGLMMMACGGAMLKKIVSFKG